MEHPISDHRTWSTLVKLYRQAADLFLIQNENIIVLLDSNAWIWSVLDILTWNKRDLEEKFY